MVVDILSLMLYTKFGCHPPLVVFISEYGLGNLYLKDND